MHILLAIGEHAVETHRKTGDAPRAFNLLLCTSFGAWLGKVIFPMLETKSGT